MNSELRKRIENVVDRIRAIESETESEPGPGA